MVEIASKMSMAESAALSARRRRMNLFVLLALLLFVAGMLALSLWHVSVEMQLPATEAPFTTP